MLPRCSRCDSSRAESLKDAVAALDKRNLGKKNRGAGGAWGLGRCSRGKVRVVQPAGESGSGGSGLPRPMVSTMRNFACPDFIRRCASCACANDIVSILGSASTNTLKLSAFSISQGDPVIEPMTARSPPQRNQKDTANGPFPPPDRKSVV